MKKFFLILSLLFPYLVSAEIVKTNDLGEVKAKYLSLQDSFKPGQIMMVFGLNNTIFYFEDAAL